MFWFFILVEVALLMFYVFIPVFRIIGLKKGISSLDASKIIGQHFPEVNDKLLNMIQLQSNKQQSELILASINQKSKELQPIPFKKAIDFKKNKKFLKYAFIPLVILMLVYFTGNITIFNESVSRVVHYNSQYEAPAPFNFVVLNNSFDVIEGNSFLVEIETQGSIYPEDAKIVFADENYYLESLGFGKFQYHFTSISKPVDFYLEANGVRSKNYQINSIATPVITNLKMVLKYPKYTLKRNEVVQNTGNAVVPQGTKISWQVETHQTNELNFTEEFLKPVNFDRSSKDYFSFSKRMVKTTNYAISTSNKQLQNHESLDFSIQVVRDEFPKLIVKSDIDSISRGPVQFIGQLSDDYGISKFQLVYYDVNNKKNLKYHKIKTLSNSFSDFYYVFPEGISVEEGTIYEMYFEVFDNDRVNGRKKTKSKVFSYYRKTVDELNEELLKEQNETINEIDKSLEKSKKSSAEVKKFTNELKRKSDFNWNDSKKLEQFLKRQSQYQEMLKKQTDQLEQNLNEQAEPESIKDHKEELEKRIQEAKKLNEKDKMLEELMKLSEKIDKEDLVNKLEQIAKKNKQNEQSLERILELTKRFYVEQRANQISEKLDELSKEEIDLSKKEGEENSKEKQKKINQKFDDLKEELKDLKNQNEGLKRPMKIPDTKEKSNEINNELKNALKELEQQNRKDAKKSQKKASKKMKELSESLEQSMQSMSGESIDENIDDLRKIVENLIEFSFQQEELLNKFSTTNNHHPEYPKNIKRQHVLKEYFEHIDDSLYLLSLRMVKMGSTIQKEISDSHFYIDKSLVNFSENRFQQGISNQQFVITSANNLANSLSDLLESLMNASPSFGKGSGNSLEFGLPDIIKKQNALGEQVDKGMKKGKKPGRDDNNGSGEEGEQRKAELYEIYKQQSQLRGMLENLIGKKEGKSAHNDVIKQMEDLEKELLDMGFTNNVVEKIKQLNHELLKLKEATLEQGEDNERKSNTNIMEFEFRKIDKLKLQKQYYNYNEILNRQSLPLRTIYKKKVQEYFKTK